MSDSSHVKRFNNEKEFMKWKSKAKKYFEDKNEAKKLLDEATIKAEKHKKGPLEEIWDKLQLMFKLVRDWISGNYKVPVGTIILVIIGLVYFVSPVDFIPDFILAAGYIDDASILAFIISQINTELENYK